MHILHRTFAAAVAIVLSLSSATAQTNAKAPGVDLAKFDEIHKAAVAIHVAVDGGSASISATVVNLRDYLSLIQDLTLTLELVILRDQGQRDQVAVTRRDGHLVAVKEGYLNTTEAALLKEYASYLEAHSLAAKWWKHWTTTKKDSAKYPDSVLLHHIAVHGGDHLQLLWLGADIEYKKVVNLRQGKDALDGIEEIAEQFLKEFLGSLNAIAQASERKD